MTLSRQLKLMCRFSLPGCRTTVHNHLAENAHPTVLIAFGTSVIVVLVAFSSFVRTIFWLAYRYLITLFAVRTPIYDLYLGADWHRSKWINHIESKVRDMKIEIRKAKQRRVAQRLKLEKKREEEAALQKEVEQRCAHAMARRNGTVPASSPGVKDHTRER